MSERWKYQIKNGGSWGLFMAVFMVLFNLKENSLYEQLNSIQFYFRLAGFLLVGIFILGYFTWKNKNF